MFGTRLRDLRKQQKLTQAELAKKLKISASTIGMYEQNRRAPDSQTITDFANFFSVSVDYLLGRTDNIFSPLKFYREDKGLTQQQVADKVGLDLDTYIAYENRTIKPDKEILNKLANIFNMPPAFIWGTIDPDDESYQESVKRIIERENKLRQSDESALLKRQPVQTLLHQIEHLPDKEIERISNLITLLELGQPIPGAIVEEVEIEIEE